MGVNGVIRTIAATTAVTAVNGRVCGEKQCMERGTTDVNLKENRTE